MSIAINKLLITRCPSLKRSTLTRPSRFCRMALSPLSGFEAPIVPDRHTVVRGVLPIGADATRLSPGGCMGHARFRCEEIARGVSPKGIDAISTRPTPSHVPSRVAMMTVSTARNMVSPESLSAPSRAGTYQRELQRRLIAKAGRGQDAAQDAQEVGAS